MNEQTTTAASEIFNKNINPLIVVDFCTAWNYLKDFYIKVDLKMILKEHLYRLLQ